MKNLTGAVLVMLLLIVHGDSMNGAEAGGDPTTAAKISDWIKELDHDAFRVRAEAEQNLIKVGRPAIDALRKAADGPQAEARARAERILVYLAKNSDIKTQDIAEAAPSDVLDDAALAKLRRTRAIEWLTAKGTTFQKSSNGMVTRIQFNEVELTDDDEPRLSRSLQHFDKVANVTMTQCKISPAAMRSFGKMPAITYLMLQGKNVTDDALAAAKSMALLQNLHLTDTSVTDKGFEHLAGLTTLRYLSINGAPVEGSGIVHLKKCTNLMYLYLNKTKVNDDALAHFKPFKSLRYLSLQDSNVTGAAFAHLKEMKLLQRIDLTRAKATDEGMAGIAHMPGLRYLIINETSISDAGIAKLKGLPNLYSIMANGTKITDAAMTDLAKLKKLNHLAITGTKVTDQGVAELKKTLPKCRVQK